MRYRASTNVLLITALAAACGSTPVKTSASPTRPAYTVIGKADLTPIGHADLVMPGASAAEARAAIREYTALLDGPAMYFVKVVRSEDADAYVCRARWYRDALAYARYSDRAERPDSWPYLTVACPAPG